MWSVTIEERRSFMKRGALIATVFVACGGGKEVQVVYLTNDTTKQPALPEVTEGYDTQMFDGDVLQNPFTGFMTKQYTTFDIPGTHYQCYIPSQWHGIYRKGKIALVHNEMEHELVIVLEVQTINTSPQELLLSLFAQKNVEVAQRYDTQAMEGVTFEGDSECVGIKIAILQFYDFVTITCSMVIPSFLTTEESVRLHQAYETVVTTLHKREVTQ